MSNWILFNWNVFVEYCYLLFACLCSLSTYFIRKCVCSASPACPPPTYFYPGRLLGLFMSGCAVLLISPVPIFREDLLLISKCVAFSRPLWHWSKNVNDFCWVLQIQSSLLLFFFFAAWGEVKERGVSIQASIHFCALFILLSSSITSVYIKPP